MESVLPGTQRDHRGRNERSTKEHERLPSDQMLALTRRKTRLTS